MKKGIGLGIDDFRQIIKEDCYYFDKTNWIEELLKDRTKIKLFTRPRRFGKTLNMSTLKYFFDVKNAEENRKLFKDLHIEKSEYFKVNIFNVFPNLLGLVNNFILDLSFIKSSIYLVLSI